MFVENISKNFAKMEILKEKLDGGENIHFNYGINSEAYACDVVHSVAKLPSRESQTAIDLASHFSPRIVGQYLHAVSQGFKDQQSIIEHAFSSRKINDHLVTPPELVSLNEENEKKVVELSEISQALSLPQNDEVGFYAYHQEKSHLVRNLMDRINGNFPLFFEQQTDLPGINSLVRHGLVKAFMLPDTSVAIAKRSNPAKPGRLELDLHNAKEIHNRVVSGDQELKFLGKTSSGLDVNIHIIRPIAVISDPSTKVLYGISEFYPHPTLEEVLTMPSSPSSLRSDTLQATRIVLDNLYEKGILWGDMAPRNILIASSSNEITLHLLDFEKARLLDHPATLQERTEHARGPMCVEEFGAICDKGEVEKTFFPYFNPKSWDTTTSDPVTFVKPKREVVSILKGRGISTFTLGDYNKAEIGMTSIRFPFLGRDRKLRFPTYVNFKIDHYLGEDYDRKTTELLMSAKNMNVLDEVVDGLSRLLRNVDDGYLRRQISVSESLFPITSENQDLFPVSEAVDELYKKKDDPNLFFRAVMALDLKRKLLDLRSSYITQPEAGMHLANESWKILEPLLSKAIETIKDVLPTDALLLLAGGASRQAITLGSDIDLSIVDGKNPASEKIRALVGQIIENETGLKAGLYPRISIDSLDSVLSASPADDILDYFESKALTGNEDLAKNFKSEISLRLRRESVQKSIINFNDFSLKAGNGDPRVVLRAMRIKSALDDLNKKSIQDANNQYLINLLYTAKNEQDVASFGLISNPLIAPMELSQAVAKSLGMNV